MYRTAALFIMTDYSTVTYAEERGPTKPGISGAQTPCILERGSYEGVNYSTLRSHPENPVSSQTHDK